MPVLGLQLTNALLLCRDGFANATLARLLGFKLSEPAPDGAFTQIHVLADLADAQSLSFDHLNHLELEARIKGSSGFLIFHVLRHSGLKKTYRCVCLN
ncbi:hypothetical protein LP417_23225 [Polaromonas sp. P1-6]|nr:hypothetical protein LP417_23225 [Polaromonas sp. P1-6]